MSSEAWKSFQENAEDVKRLLDLHNQLGGNKKGRRYGLEVLNKSAIVLITSFWESYCEDLASEGVQHLVQHASAADALPAELKKLIAKEIKSEVHELEVWKLADDGWKGYLGVRLERLKLRRNMDLNTPKTEKINDLFRSSIGCPRVSDSWYWSKTSAQRAGTKLDEFVSLRGAIAHRGKHVESVTKAQVEIYFDLVWRIASKTGGAVSRQVRKATGKSLW